MSTPLPHDHIKPFGETGSSKKEQVADMFNNIAGRYDLMNRLLSARIDLRWRKKAIRSLRPHQPRHILDVATGTADMALLTWKLLQPDFITGIDISEGMLDLGRKKIEKEGLADKIRLFTGDAETINFPDHSFDAVMVAFGVRNFENLQQGLREMRRVLKPGGQLVVLEFSKPRTRIFKGLYRLYMSVVAPQVARWLRQNKAAYQYLNESASAFPDRQLFIDQLNEAGYTGCRYQSLTLGICCIYTAQNA